MGRALIWQGESSDQDMKQYDLIVIGTGPAGHHGAVQAAKLGKSVAVVETRSIGGACIHTGTIPSKTIREAVLQLYRFKQWGFYGAGREGTGKFSIEHLVQRLGQVIRSETAVYDDQFRRNGVAILNGLASFVNPHVIRVANEEGQADFATQYVLIATGTRPAHNDSIPFDGAAIFDSDAVVNLPMLPEVLTIVGGGVVGAEYGCMAAAMGIEVTMIERESRMLDFVDDQIVEALGYHMGSHGVTFRHGEEALEVIKTSEGKVCVKLKSNKEVWSDALLYAVGRQGNTESLNLAAAGVKADERGRLSVNEAFQTAVPHIYAAGDVIGFPSLASVSMEQGRLAACHAFRQPTSCTPHLFPYGIYSIPEISFVGKTERQLTEEGVPYEVGLANYREIARGQIIGDTSGLLKLLFHRKTRRLLGVHIIGEGATELIHIGQTALAFEGTVEFFVSTVFNYPTLAECYKVAALDAFNRLNYPGRDAKCALR